MFKALIDFIAYSLVVSIVFILRILPLPLAVSFARGIVSLGRLLMPRASGVGMKNLEIVFPEKSNSEHREVLKNSYRVLALNLLMFARSGRLNEELSISEFQWGEGREVIKSAMAEARENGKGIIVATLHTGCFEYLVQAYTLSICPIAMLAREFGLPRLDAWWTKQREKFGSVVFSRAGGYREIVRRLNDGQDVAILFDQNVRGGHATFVDLFGKKAATTKALALAALRTGSPLVFCACASLGPKDHKVYVKRIDTLGEMDADRDAKVDIITRSMNECLEELVHDHPEQWFWIHRRFKTRPEGEPENVYSKRDIRKRA